MVYCQECGAEVGEDQEFCGECGAEMAPETGDQTFIDKYGAKPLPFANGRGEFMRIYGKLMGAIPLFGSLVKIFAGIAFWSYSIWLKILKIITLGADVTQRFVADFNYIKDNFYSGYNGDDSPPSPP